MYPRGLWMKCLQKHEASLSSCIFMVICMKQKLIQKICPTCGSDFLANKSRKQIYCSMSCLKKSYYKPSTKIQNPIATIQEVTIRYTVHTQGNFENTTRDELLWFVQGNGKMGNLKLNELKKRKFKVSDILLHNGYKIENPSQFDKEFAILIKKL